MEAWLNHTHDERARSWLASANNVATDFPIQNLPFGVFRRRQSGESFRGGVAIGDQVLDLAALANAGRLQGLAAEAAAACATSSLNAFFEQGPVVWQALRHALFDVLHVRNAAQYREMVETCLVPQNAIDTVLRVARCCLRACRGA